MGTQVPVGTGMFSVLHKFDSTDNLAQQKHLLEDLDGLKTHAAKDKGKGKGKAKAQKAALTPKRKLFLQPSDGKKFTALSVDDLLK